MEINRINPYTLKYPSPLKFGGIKQQQKNILNTVVPKKEIADVFESSVLPSSYTETNGSREELEQQINQIIDYGCKLYGIPEELKPALNVVDSIQYAPTEEITQKFKEALPDKDIDLDIFSSSKKQPKDMSRSEFISYVSKQTKTSKKEIEKIIQTGNGKDKGYYSSVDNSITYYTDGYRQGSETIEETILHELYHAKEAIIRSALPQEDRDEIVKDELLTRLTQKESRNVFKQFPKDDNMASAMMTVPIFDDTTRVALTNFAQENLFTEDYTLHDKMQRYSELLEQENPDEEELAKAKADLGGLAEKIEEISAKSKLYKENQTLFQSVFGLSKKEKNKLLFDYMMSVEFRYQYYREKEIENVPTTQKAKEYRNIAKKSINDHIGSTQATYAMNIARQSKKKTGDELYWEYYTSREEVGARINSEKREVDILKLKLSNSVGNTSRAEVKKIRKQLKEKKAKYKEDLVYYNFFKAEDEFKADQKNLIKWLKYYNASYTVQLMKTSHNKSPLQKIALGTYCIIGILTNYNQMFKHIRI